MRAFFASLLSAAALPLLAQASNISTAADIVAQLGPRLSSGSLIFGKDDDRWENATDRWSAAPSHTPSFSVVVEPATEADIPVIVKFANAHNVPFLAMNRRHGAPSTLSKMKNGIEISLVNLDDITIAEDGQSARMQGGAWNHEVVATLWDAGYLTGTGICMCVGLLGPGLGGGHGPVQGFYGLESDGFISLDVVLADGSAVTVSETSHPDLWWAMRGAGHNFGIVTGVTAKIHKPTSDTWYLNTLVYTQDKLEDLFTMLNTQLENGGQQQELMNYGTYIRNPEISDEPVLVWFFGFVGSAEDAAPHLQPFLDVGPISNTSQSLAYPDVHDQVGTGLNSPMCQKGHTNMQSPFGLVAHNVTANRQVYDYFANVTAERDVFNQSMVVFEAYSVKGLQAVDPASSAFPHRTDNLLYDVLITYTPDTSLDDEAAGIAKHISELWAQGQPGQERHTYVNYAFGDEPLTQIYGTEQWRWEKLLAAKAKYDPKNAFRYYNPLIRT